MRDRRWLAVTVPAVLIVGAADAVAQDWRSVASTRRYDGEERLAVDVQYGAGEIRLAPAGSDVLYRIVLEYDPARHEPVQTYSNGRLRVALGGRRDGGRGSSRSGRLDVQLSPSVLLDLDLSFGAAKADLDFGGLRIQRLEISTGASDTELRFSTPNPVRAEEVRIVAGAAAFRARQLGNANARRLVVDGGVGDVHLDFSGEWQGDMEADLDIGMGALTLVLPRDVGVRVVRSTFLASFNPQGLERGDDGYYSSNWGEAAYRLTVDVGAAFGAINVRWAGDTR